MAEDEFVPLLAELVRDADCVLIAAGAGMSIDAGNDYGDPVAFAERFPGMVKRGFRIPYQMIGHRYESRELQWGYLSGFVSMLRNLQPAEVYQTLLATVADKNYFVITSNVDGLFEQNGFDSNRVYTCQGDMRFMQCLTNDYPCREDAWWPSEPVLAPMISRIDHDTQLLMDPALIPICPHCGGSAMMSVRGGNWFLEGPFEAQRERYEAFVNNAIEHNQKLVIIEIGAGFNTPGVIRGRMEVIAERHPIPELVTFARINPEFPDIPDSVRHALEIPMLARDFVQQLAASVMRT